MASSSFARRQAAAKAAGYSGYSEQRRARALAAAGDRSRLRPGDITGPERRAAQAAARAAKQASKQAAQTARKAAKAAKAAAAAAKPKRKRPRLQRVKSTNLGTIMSSAGNSRTVDRMVNDALKLAIRTGQRVSFRVTIGPKGTRVGTVQVLIGPPSAHPKRPGLSPIEIQSALSTTDFDSFIAGVIEQQYDTRDNAVAGELGTGGYWTLVISDNADWADLGDGFD